MVFSSCPDRQAALSGRQKLRLCAGSRREEDTFASLESRDSVADLPHRITASRYHIWHVLAIISPQVHCEMIFSSELIYGKKTLRCVVAPRSGQSLTVRISHDLTDSPWAT